MKCSATAWAWFEIFLLKAFVSRVNRRMPILIVRFCLSTKLVEIAAGSGWPMMTWRSQPIHFAGL